MWTWLLDALKVFWAGRKEASDAIAQGFGTLIEHQQAWQEKVETRLDECDEDRRQLRSEIGGLKILVSECHEDRDDLKARLEVLETRTQ